MPRLDLPPPYGQMALHAGGDAFGHACAVALAEGAGTLAWSDRADRVDVAVVLEPAETLEVARQVIFSVLNAAADALAVIAPPEKPIAFRWPDAILFDGGLVGGARLAWPAGCGEAEVPDWLVVGIGLRVALGDAPPGVAPPAALIEDGFEDFEVPAFIESFARHLMAALDDWSARGPASQLSQWRQRSVDAPMLEALPGLLAVPSWCDKVSGAIRA